MKRNNQGITLVALVITIIVLLILAGVSIATLTGENGVLMKANKASMDNEIAGAREKVQVAVIGSFGDDGNINNSELKTNLNNVEGIDKKTIPSEILDTIYPFEVTVDGHKVKIEKNGKVMVVGDNPEPNLPTSITVEEAKDKKILDENNPTTIIDTYGNEITVPEGFKIAEDSATDVTGGVVIEDVSHGATAGSQFVWIPVGMVYTNMDKSTSENITLGRYLFNKDGSVNENLSKIEPEDHLIKDLSYKEYYFTEGLKESITTNTHAKDIKDFRTSVTTNKGYYIGRYEARSVEIRTSNINDLAQITVKPDNYVYNYVTQPQSATLARGMYEEGKQFTSDLINSYVWDTAIVFLQTFDNRADKTTPYSQQRSLNSSLANQGTNYLEAAKQDKICNVWDMASNHKEWNTESWSASDYPWVARGGGSGLRCYWLHVFS